MKTLIRFALRLLVEHNDQWNPYIDDYPTARYEAKRHREACDICKYIDAHPGLLAKIRKMAGKEQA